MKDPQIEDISCDGTNIPIFLYHRRYHNVKTNILFEEEPLNSLAITLAQRSGKHISVGSPILDATLPDGSRLQLTFSTVVTSRGTSFSIRKFREEPFTPIELLERGTFPVDAMAYFWLAIENNKSLLFIGGTASGKTTSLNAVSHFIPPLAKVVSIEDTREITLNHDNWIASVTRDAAIDAGAGAITMFDLLRAAMRQRPEYLIVGEVRGPEAQTLFQAMNTGHTTFSTLHAADVDAAVHRLENEPLSVPRNMLQALDIVSIQALIYRGTERMRKCQEIVEIMGLDQATQNIQVNTVFSYDPVSDTFNFSGRSQVYNEIMAARGWSSEDLEKEILKRGKILLAMKEQGVKDYIAVSHIFQDYAIKPDEVMENLGDLEQADRMNAKASLFFWIRSRRDSFSWLHDDLISARSGVTIEHYLFQTYVITLFSGIFCALAGYITADTIASMEFSTTIYDVFNIYRIFPQFVPMLIFRSVMTIIAFIGGSILGYQVMVSFPALLKGHRGTRVNLTLHNAVAYMYAMQRGGAELSTIFSSLAENASIFGEVAIEFRQFMRDIDYFGYDLISALKHLGDTTPSEKFRDFIQDLLSVIDSGSSQGEFFAGRVRIYQEEARFEMKQFIATLEFVAETYVTLFVAGPLFLIIIMIVMGIIGGMGLTALSVVCYALIPIGSILFIVFLSMISEKVEPIERYIQTKVLDVFFDVKVVHTEGEEAAFQQAQVL